MNKDALLSSLEGNDQIGIHSVSERLVPPGDTYYGRYFQLVDVVIFPTEGMYTAAELNLFLETISAPIDVPGFTMNPFREGIHDLNCGDFSFNEVIGEEVVVATLTDPEMFNKDGFVDGKHTLRRSLYRNIHVNVTPDAVTAALAFRRDDIEISGPNFNIAYSRINWDVINSIRDGISTIRRKEAVAA